MRDVVFDALGIDLAGILQHDLLLALEKGDAGGTGLQAEAGGVCPGVHRPNDLRGVHRADVGEHSVLGFHRDQRTGAAQPHAADALDEHLVLHARFDHFHFQRVAHQVGAAGETPGGDADADMVLELFLRVALRLRNFM